MSLWRMWLDVYYFIDDNKQINTSLFLFNFENELMHSFIRKLFIIIVFNQLWYYYIQTPII
jgi:hypothetical protein